MLAHNGDDEGAGCSTRTCAPRMQGAFYFRPLPPVCPLQKRARIPTSTDKHTERSNLISWSNSRGKQASRPPLSWGGGDRVPARGDTFSHAPLAPPPAPARDSQSRCPRRVVFEMQSDSNMNFVAAPGLSDMAKMHGVNGNWATKFITAAHTDVMPLERLRSLTGNAAGTRASKGGPAGACIRNVHSER